MESGTGSGNGTKGRILVVEDHPAIRRLVVAALRAQDFEVHEADRGDRALATAEAAGGPLRAAVLDLGLPGKNGREAAVDLRARWPGLPVLYMTGSAEFGDLEGILGPGTLHLQKPFTPDQLLERVAELLP